MDTVRLHARCRAPARNPRLGIITGAERDALLEEPDEYGVGLVLWNPGEYDIVGVLELPGEANTIADALLEVWEHDPSKSGSVENPD